MTDLSKEYKGHLNRSNLLANLIRSRNPKFAIPFAVGNGKVIDVALMYVSYIESDSELSVVHFQNYKRKKIKLAQSISSCERLLLEYGFIRIHRSFLLNLSYLKKLEKSESNWFCSLYGEVLLPISRRKKKEVLSALSYLNIDHL